MQHAETELLQMKKEVIFKALAPNFMGFFVFDKIQG